MAASADVDSSVGVVREVHAEFVVDGALVCGVASESTETMSLSSRTSALISTL
jgi:hypothetical protein